MEAFETRSSNVPPTRVFRKGRRLKNLKIIFPPVASGADSRATVLDENSFLTGPRRVPEADHAAVKCERSLMSGISKRKEGDGARRGTARGVSSGITQ